MQLLFSLLIITLLSRTTLSVFQSSSLITLAKSFEQVHNLVYNTDYLSVLNICSSKSPKCREIESEYIRFAEAAQTWAKVYGVDCAILDQKEAEDSIVCSSHKVDDYPILVFFEPTINEDGEKEMVEHLYEGIFEVDSLEEFGLEHMPSYLESIKNKEGLEEFLNKGKIPNSVILFTEDTDIPASYKAISAEYKDRIKFGVVNIASTSLIAEFKIEKLPTVLIVKGNKKENDSIEVFNGKFEVGELNEFVKPFALKEKISLRKAHETLSSDSDVSIQTLTSKNFTEEVRKHEQLVMVHLYEEEPHPLWNETITKFQTLFKYYNFSCKSKKAKAFVKDNLGGINVFPSIIVLPLGKKHSLIPSLHFMKFNNMVEITKEISDSIADKTLKFGSHQLQEEITKALLNKKPIFVVFYDSRDISISYRVVSQLAAYKDKAVYANVRLPSKDITEAFGIEKLPSLIAIFAEGGQIKDSDSKPEYVQIARFKEKFVFHEVKKFVVQLLAYIASSEARPIGSNTSKQPERKIQYDEL